MSYSDLAEIRLLKSPVVQRLLLSLQQSLNQLNEDNFPNPVSADTILAAASATGSTILKDASTPLKKLNFLEWTVPLVLPSQPFTTTSTTGADCGGFFVFDPVKFPGGTWYLEAALQTSVASSNATLQLKNGSTVIGSVSSGNTAWTVTRSAALTMPTSQAALTVTLVSAASTTTAGMWAARLIYVP